ncbi:MAG: hypothetical protein ACFFCD_12245 [Promethearchaeota archaeon]
MIQTESTSKARLISFLLIGTLSMFFAEIFSGASATRLWFIDPWSLIVTWPLYFAHTLFFLNVAFRTKRTSIHQLYLFGTLFALYESWITKVLWAGYFGQTPILGTIGGIAILEFSVLVFFWHPFLAFIMPIMTFQVFASENKSPEQVNAEILHNHTKYLIPKKRNKLFLILLIVIGSLFLSLNTGYNIPLAIGASLGTVALILLFAKLAQRNSFSIYSLQLGKTGFIVVTLYLVILYIVTFFILLPERIPSFLPIILIILIYLVIILLIKFSKQNINEPTEANYVFNEPLFNFKDFLKYSGLFIGLTVILCIIPPIAIIFTILANFAISFLGPAIFIYMTYQALRSK